MPLVNLTAIVADICEAPVDYRRSGKSWIAVIAESGYVEARRSLSIELLTEYLHSHPNLINEWERWSQDQRGSPAWWFSLETFEIGIYPGEERLRFNDAETACAEYILHSIDHTVECHHDFFFACQ